MEEEWRPIYGYEDTHEISSFGRTRRKRNGRIFSGSGEKEKYCRVMLGKDGSQKYEYVHILVARAFLGECPAGKEVNHIDGNTQNPTVGNLEYVTRSENNSHYWTLPKSRINEASPKAKLTAEQVRQIRTLRGTSSNRKLGKQFGVSESAVRAVLSGKYWGHLQ